MGDTVDDSLFISNGAGCTDGTCAATYSYSFDGTSTGTFDYTVFCDFEDPCGTSNTGQVTVESCVIPTPGCTMPPVCKFDIIMLGSEEFTIRVDCCDDTTFEGHTVFDPDELHFLTIDRNTAVVCGDCVGCGNYPMLVVMTISDDPPADPDFGVIIGPVYEINGYKGNRLCSAVTLGKPGVLSLNYDPDELPGDTASVYIGFYNEETGMWEGLQFPGGIAEEGVAKGLFNHMSTFAVIAELEQESSPEEPPAATPTSPASEPEPPLPAHFVLGGLSVSPMEKFVGIGNIAFMLESGKNVTISADVANDGGQSGSYSASLIINGKTASTREITLGPGQGQELTFTLSDNEPGQYVVQIGDLQGGFTTVRWINRALIAGLAVAFGFLVWAIWYFGFRRRRRLQS